MSVRNRIGAVVLAVVLLLGIIVAIQRLDLLAALKRMHGIASAPIETIRRDG